MNEVWKKPPISSKPIRTWSATSRRVVMASGRPKRIDVYADVIEDHQFIHVDPEQGQSGNRRSAPPSRTVS